MHKQFSFTFLALLCILLLCFTQLTACISPPADESGGESESTSGAESPGSTSAPESDAEDALIAYYIAIVAELEAEVLRLKEENFILESEKEALLAGGTDIRSPFTYAVQDGKAIITGYRGSEEIVTIPAELDGCPVVAIGESAFADSAVKEIVLPDSVSEIGWFAFSGCYRLTRLTAVGVTSVGYGAFDGCPSALTLVCPKDSYLAAYGKSFGIAVQNS